ncbi:hypothetical protein [Cellulophaga sp. Asnod2-G02]
MMISIALLFLYNSAILFYFYGCFLKYAITKSGRPYDEAYVSVLPR